MPFLKLGQKIDKVMGKEQELLDAARTGNVQIVEKLLSNRSRQSVGGGVLTHRLTSILHAPVNVNCTDKNGYTPLHHATVNGHRDVVEKLLKAEAQPGNTDHQGCTPCHLAAWRGDAEICMQLLNAGTENVDDASSEIVPVHVNQQNLSGDTALHSAAQYGHIAVVDVLLQKNANPNIRNLQEESPLDLAAQYGKKEVVQLLLIKFADLVQRPLGKHCPLHLASRNGHREIVAVLLDAGFSINTVTETGTALHEAALYGKSDVVKLLLERGINISEKDQNGLTALDLIDKHKSKQKSYVEIKNAILDHIQILQQAEADMGDYKRLVSTAQKTQESPEKESPKPRERPIPKPRPGTSVIESPTGEPPKDPYGYSKPQKEKVEDLDRVTSSTGSICEAGPPPPLPPRTSIFPTDDKIPVIIEPKDLPVSEASKTESNTAQPSNKPTATPRPKKPPRQKKSPLPARKTDETESSSSEPAEKSSAEQSPSSPPPQLPPKPESPQIPPRHSSKRKSPAMSSATLDFTNEIKENHVSDSTSLQTNQSHSKADENDQSNSMLDGPKSEQLHSLKEESKKDHTDSASTKTDQAQPIYSEIDQSNKSPTETGGSFEDQLSPPPELPPRPYLLGTENPPMTGTIETVDPVFGTPVKQNVYMEMKPAEKKIEKEKSELKPDDVNTDSYGILFPKFKNSKASVLPLDKESGARPELRRTNTTPDENIYIGPSSPDSTLAKFKEKQGLLRRANTSPDENMYVTVTDKILKRQKKVDGENLYSEIAEQKSPNSPQSPKENLYASIPDEASNLYEQLANATSGKKEDSAGVSAKKDASKTGDSEQTQVTESDPSEQIPTGVKPNYLDFVARKSLSQGPLTPTGYAQPPTPDFPPPSPETALQGIEMKIQEMEFKRKSRDITTLTDETLENTQDQCLTTSTDSADSDAMSKRGPPPPPKPKPSRTKSASSPSENKPLPGVKPPVKTREAFQRNDEQSTERSEAFQITEITDTFKKSVQTTGSSAEKSVSFDSKNLVTENKSATVITSTENVQEKQTADRSMVKKQTTERQEVDQSGSNESAQSESPVMLRKKSSTASSPQDMEHFKDLLKGSNPGGPRKVVSQFVYDNDQNKPGRSRPIKSTYVTFDPAMEKEEDDNIDVDDVMQSIEIDLRRKSGNTDSFDEAGMWDEINDILHSAIGSGMKRKTIFEREDEANFIRNFRDHQQSIAGWLEDIGLDQYENNFRVNGFDNLDFLGTSIMEEQDLEQIGIRDHTHRKKILQAAELLPRITPIDPKNLPASVEVWLASLRLDSYLDNFLSHGYQTMEQVQSILWDLQLRTVLNISMLGHRKRILASLGERQLERQNGTVKKRSLSSLSPDESPSTHIEVPSLVKDYRNIKSTKSSSEDVRGPSQMTVDGGDDDVFKPGFKGKSIRNSDIHLRPPHIAQTQSPARKWRHTPETLIKGCCNYTAEYLGSTGVAELAGVESTREGITKLKKSTDMMGKIPVIMLSISYKGVKFIDAKSKRVICDHEIGNIFCACQDTEDLRFFAYITRDIETAKHYCHVFKVKSSSLAHDIILTLGESFEVAYQMALKDKASEEAMELDRLQSQSDTEDLYSKIGPKVDSNTV